MDGERVQVDFILISSHLQVVHTQVDWALPIGLDHRCVHSVLQLPAAGRPCIRKRRGLRFWKPHRDQHGKRSVFQAALSTALAGCEEVCVSTLEECLVKAGKKGGHERKTTKLLPAVLLL